MKSDHDTARLAIEFLQDAGHTTLAALFSEYVEAVQRLEIEKAALAKHIDQYKEHVEELINERKGADKRTEGERDFDKMCAPPVIGGKR